MSVPRVSFLNGSDFMRLNDACIRIREAFGDHPYLVGSATEKFDYRDVDVRSVLPEEQFDELFKGKEFLWSLFCFGVSAYLTTATGLPVDFQVQRGNKANALYKEGIRVPMGFSARLYAGGGDATEF